MNEHAVLTLTADRDSVCAGDDGESHARTFAVALHATVVDLVGLAAAACPPASITGGQATWIVEVGGHGGQPVAIVAQQWAEARLLLSHGETVGSLFHQRPPAVFFKYWGQADPQAVVDALMAGAPLPSRHG